MSFKYKLKTNYIVPGSWNYMIDYLQSLGIEKVESFMGMPAFTDEEHYNKLEQIEEMIEELHYSFENDKKFFLQVDSDADGITSAAIFYSYFKTIYPNAHIEYRLHDGKEHGVILDTVPVESDVIVIPDAGSNQHREHQQLTSQGRKVLVIDHHLVDNMVEYDGLTVVNNQLSPNFNNKSLSGAGVVYKVIQAYSNKYHNGITHKEFIDLAALGIISDMMDTRNLDNNFIIYHGLNNIKNPMFQAMLNKQSYSVSSSIVPNKIDIAFYITPLINGVIRAGSKEEKQEMFEGFINYEGHKTVTRMSKGQLVQEDYYDSIARMAYNVKNRQNRVKEKCLDFLNDRIVDNNLHENQIILVKTSKDDEVAVPKNITGLVAMEMLKRYKKPSLVLRPKMINGKKCYAGSGRAKKAFGFDSFRDFLKTSGHCEYAEGHNMAFGYAVLEEEIPQLLEYANKTLKDIDFGSDMIEVDYIFKDNVDRKILKDFAENTSVYGNGIPQPKFAFEINVTKDQIKVVGKNKNTIQIRYNNVTFVKFKDSELAEQLTNGSYRVDLTMIGRSQINEFNGYKNVQIMIDNIKVKERTLKSLF